MDQIYLQVVELVISDFEMTRHHLNLHEHLLFDVDIVFGVVYLVMNMGLLMMKKIMNLNALKGDMIIKTKYNSKNKLEGVEAKLKQYEDE